MEDINLVEYQKTVEMYAKEGTNFLFHNQGNEHALIVFKSIFNNANKKICIAAASLDNREVANNKEYIDAMKSYLEKENSKLLILLSNPVTDPSTLPLFVMIKEHKSYKEGRVAIKDGKGKNFHMNGRCVHFCVADNRMYRLESDIVNRTAECNFGDDVRTKYLTDLFERAFENVNDIYNIG